MKFVVVKGSWICIGQSIFGPHDVLSTSVLGYYGMGLSCFALQKVPHIERRSLIINQSFP